MSYYQEGNNRTVENYWSAQIPCKSLDSLLCLLDQIYSTKSDISIGFQRHGSSARSDISDLRSDISDQLDLFGHHQVPELWQLPRSDISDPMSDISDPPDLSGLHRVPEPCHLSLIGYIRAPSDISDPAKLKPI
jgi:hypothetical protein